MKRILALTLLGIAAVTTTYGQGAFRFSNYAAPYVPIAAGSTLLGPTSGVQIQVWAGAGNVGADALTLLGNANWSATSAGYTDQQQVFTISAPPFVGGSTWTLQLRAIGTVAGEPVDILASRGPLVVTSNIGNLGGSPPGTPQFNYTPGFQVVTAIIPEPSTFALAGLGAAALLIFRRRA